MLQKTFVRLYFNRCDELSQWNLKDPKGIKTPQKWGSVVNILNKQQLCDYSRLSSSTP